MHEFSFSSFLFRSAKDGSLFHCEHAAELLITGSVIIEGGAFAASAA